MLTLPVPIEHAPALHAARAALLQLVPTNADVWAHADAVAAIVQPLGVDDDIVVGAMLFPLLAAGLVDTDKATLAVGRTATHIAAECVRLLQFGGSGQRLEAKALSAGTIAQDVVGDCIRRQTGIHPAC